MPVSAHVFRRSRKVLFVRPDNGLVNNQDLPVVEQSTGWRGYHLLTDPALERMQLSRDALLKRCETYQHPGDVDIDCIEMHLRYDRLKDSCVWLKKISIVGEVFL
jgi:hypothetical protein